jgi:hypothetical protein
MLFVELYNGCMVSTDQLFMEGRNDNLIIKQKSRNCWQFRLAISALSIFCLFIACNDLNVKEEQIFDA